MSSLLKRLSFSSSNKKKNSITQNNNNNNASATTTITSDAGIEILAPYLEGNTALKSIDFYESQGITDKSIPFLMKMIGSSHIEDIDIDGTSITQRNFIAPLLALNSFKYGSTQLNLSYK